MEKLVPGVIFAKCGQFGWARSIQPTTFIRSNATWFRSTSRDFHRAKAHSLAVRHRSAGFGRTRRAQPKAIGSAYPPWRSFRMQPETNMVSHFRWGNCPSSLDRGIRRASLAFLESQRRSVGRRLLRVLWNGLTQLQQSSECRSCH